MKLRKKMPTYNFRNIETGEETEVIMRIAELDNYKANHPELQQILKSPPKIVSDIGGVLSKTDGGWNDTLKRIKAGAGRNNTIHTKN